MELSAGEAARVAGALYTIGHLGNTIEAGIGKAPVGELLGGKDTYSGMCCTYYTTSETAACGWTKRKTREGRYSSVHFGCISANPILPTQTRGRE